MSREAQAVNNLMGAGTPPAPLQYRGKMARKNPTISGTSVGLPPVVDDLENPLPSGVNVGLKEKANEMPEVDMKTNDGDNPKVGQTTSFGDGKDLRSTGPSPTTDPFDPRVFGIKL